MIDFIVIVAVINPIYDFNSFIPFEWKELKFYPKFKKGKLLCFESEFGGLRINIYYDKIEISNSFHKFLKGNNYSDFSYSELQQVITMISEKFDISPKYWEIKKMEFGFNILMEKSAKTYLYIFRDYKGRPFEKMTDKHKDYGRKCFMSEYALKVYAKQLQTKKMDCVLVSSKLLRIEFCYNQKRMLPKLIRNLDDLMDSEKFKELFKDLSEAFSLVVYNDEINFSNSSREERMLFYASLNPDYIKAEEKFNKEEIKAIKLNIKQLKERFLEKTFKKKFINLLKTKYIELYCS